MKSSEDKTVLIEMPVQTRASEIEEARENIGDSFPDKEVIITTKDTDITELPAVEEIVDEIENRLVKSIQNEMNGGERL